MFTRRLRAGVPAAGPFLSVIIPARNEQLNIAATVRGMLAQTYAANLEVIVVDDRSTDRTGAILSEIAATDPRLVVVHGTETPDGWLGKPWALHQGSQIASGKLLLFVDADIVYARDAIAAAVADLLGHDVAMITVLPHLEMRGFWENVAMPQLSLTAFTYLPLWLSNVTGFPRLGIGGGTGNLLWRAAYDRAGGHEALKDAVVDDVGMARLLRHQGLRTQAVLATELITVRMYRGLAEIIEGFTKNTFAIMGRSYITAITVLFLALLFHVWPFVLGASGDVVAATTVAIITLTRLVLFRALKHNIVAALLAHPLSMLLWIWIMLRSMWLTGIRRTLTWRGRSYDASRTRFGAER